MADTSLKKLAKAYAIGEITKYDYRQQRSTVIDELTGYKGSTEDSSPHTIPFIPPADQEHEQQHDQKHDVKQKVGPGNTGFADNNDISLDFNFDIPEEHQEYQSSSGFRLIFIISALTVLVLMVLFIYPQPSPETPATVENAALTPDPRRLVETFVNKQEWAQSDIAEFLINWLRLSDQQKQAAQQEVWFQSLVDSLRKRQIELKALADLGTPDAQQKETQIKLLAESLDVYL